MMAWRAAGICTWAKSLPVVLFTTWSAVISSSSPSLGLDGRADHDLQAEVDGVLQEDARDALGHDHELVALEALSGLLAARAAAEVLVRRR